MREDDHSLMVQHCLPNLVKLLCTEKDAVKLWPHFPQAWAVPLHCQLPEDLLAQLLVDVQGLSSRHG
jgi:tetraacyldisaccharide 4'-kinase